MTKQDEKRKKELEAQLDILHSEKETLALRIKAIEDELTSIEYGVKIGDEIQENNSGRRAVIVGFSFWPIVRWFKKDGQPGKGTSSIHRDFTVSKRAGQ
jgi:hypothetical protein